MGRPPCLARSLEGGSRENIEWIEATAEVAALGGPIDLIIAGASIHWMDAGRVFPRLAQVLSPRGVMAIIGGDGPAEAPWLEAWNATIIEWVGRMGDVWNGPAHRARVAAHEPWFEEKGRETFSAPATRSMEDLIEAEHSRATWARSKMGERAADFDADLRAVLAPHATDGMLAFGVRSNLTWGRPRSASRQARGIRDRGQA